MYFQKISCKICQKAFEIERPRPGRLPKFCSLECKKINGLRDSVKNRPRYKGRYNEWRRKHPGPLVMKEKTCVICGVQYQCRREAFSAQKTCGKLCGVKLAHRSRSENAAKRNTGSCVVCGKAFRRYRLSAEQRATGHVQKTCSSKCAVKANAQEDRSVNADRWRQKTEVRLKIDLVSILERDGWICYLCGDEAPRDLRGTFNAKAPEVDHIIPVSRGGSHTPGNCACAHRGCNFAKAYGFLSFGRMMAAFSAVHARLWPAAGAENSQLESGPSVRFAEKIASK